MLKRPELFALGFHLTHFPLTPDLRETVIAENWNELDKKFQALTKPDGELFRFLNSYHDFSEIEFIISIRDAGNEWEEDGIWHDDGSRVYAFSLSLTLDRNGLKGGRLGLRRKGESQVMEIPTPEYGGIIMFLTGTYGFEHKIHQVTEGRRIIIAGWCS
ncbi:MAG TPA: 2OG-Fe(II) oxygenase [Bacteriovoracaceae bacterium]|nr:2OG-Fe(II) oxygenase [Bacteriovoracaceae bacterium]